MSANNSISQLLEQFIELYNNSLSTFEKTNEAITTDKETVAIDLYDPKKGSVKTVQIPSFGFLLLGFGLDVQIKLLYLLSLLSSSTF